MLHRTICKFVKLGLDDLAPTSIGFKIRDARKKAQLTQKSLAEKVGISASYLNLIEHNKRTIAGALLLRIAAELDLDVANLSGREDTRLIQQLVDITADPIFKSEQLSEAGAQMIVERFPGWAHAILKAHAAWRTSELQAEALSDRLNHNPFLTETSHTILSQITAIRSAAEILNSEDEIGQAQRSRFLNLLAEQSAQLSASSTDFFQYIRDGEQVGQPMTAAEEVNDFLIDKNNYFGEIEHAASQLRAAITTQPTLSDGALTEFLLRNHAICVRYGDVPHEASGHPTSSAQFVLDRPQKTLIVRPSLAHPTLVFQLARVAFELSHQSLIATIADTYPFSGSDARLRARHALARYGAGAMMLPYDEVLDRAQTLRYDIQVMAAHFGASYEQICHRLVTLRRPDAEGIPFAFMRIDAAGNTSKRFNLPEIRIPRFGGACTIWPVYRALHTPGQVVAQLSRMPDGQTILMVARSVSKESGRFGAPPQVYSVMLACDAVYADRIVYGDVVDQRSSTNLVPTGVNCRLCPRRDCAHRAHAPILAAGAANDHLPNIAAKP